MYIVDKSGYVMDQKKRTGRTLFKHAWVVHKRTEGEVAIHRVFGWTNPRDYCHPIIRSESGSRTRILSRERPTAAPVICSQLQREVKYQLESNVNNAYNAFINFYSAFCAASKQILFNDGIVS